MTVKKERAINPSRRSKLAFDKMVENGGVISKAMIDVGYSPNTAKTPQKLTESKGWQKLMEQYIPDKLLAQKHKELLTVPKKIRHYKKGDLETEVEELDSNAVSKGLDMAYKMKGRYAPDANNIFVPVQIVINKQNGNQDSNSPRETIPGV